MSNKISPFEVSPSKQIKFNVTSTDSTLNKVRVKFNFPLINSDYDHGLALRKAKEEKSFIPYNMQKTIDFAMSGSTYNAGEIYEVSEEFFEQWSQKFVETYNPIFGAFQGSAIEFTKRLKLPYIIKVDIMGNVLDPMQHKLDIYPTRH